MNRGLIINCLEENVRRNPNKIAVIYNDFKLTYQQFHDYYTSVANNIIKITNGNNCIIPLRTKSKLSTLISIFGILKAGAAWLPLPKEMTYHKCKEILNEIETKFIITDIEEEKYHEKESMNYNLFINNTNTTGESTVSPVYKDEAISYLIYTSGTTGKPKGCVIEDKSFVGRINTLHKEFSFKEDDNYLFSTNYSFDVSITEIFGWVLGGGSITVHSSAIEIKELPKYIYENNVTHLAFSPSYFKVLYKSKENFLDKIKYLFLAGEAFPLDLAEKLTQNNNMKIINAYGPTEATIYATYFDLINLSSKHNSVPIGKALEGVDIQILRGNKLVKSGHEGELLIGGEGLAREYYKRPEITKEKFIYINEKKFYRTGDLAIKRNGIFYYLGRLDNQIKINGIRVEAEDIESKLKKILPIEDATVRLENFEGKGFLVAYIKAETKVEILKYKSMLKRQIESYFIPKIFVAVKEFPLNKNNKIDYKKLKNEFLKEMSLHSKSFQVLDSDVNSKLKYIWSRLLKKKINETDDFYLNGGDSLDTVSLLIEIEEIFGVSLEYEDIINNSTLNQLEKIVGERLYNSNLQEFREYWTNVNLNIDLQISIEDEEKILKVKTDSERKLIERHLQELGEEIHPDRILSIYKDNETKYNAESELLFPYLSDNIKDISSFPLFSRQEFYLRKNFNSILSRNIILRGSNKTEIIKAINTLIQSQQLFNVVISSKDKCFKVKPIPEISTERINYIDLASLNSQDARDNIKRIKKNYQTKMEALDGYDSYLFEILIIKENLNKHRVIFFLNHHIADGFSLNLLEREFRYIHKYGVPSTTSYNYQSFVQDVIKLCKDGTIEDIKNSDYYKELKQNQNSLSSSLVLDNNAPIYEIIMENTEIDKEKRGNLVFDKITKIIEETYGVKRHCYQILKNLNRYNNKDYSSQIGDFHVSIFVPFSTEKESSLFSKSEELLHSIYGKNKWHLDYLCSSEKYQDNNYMSLFPEIKLSINYLGEFTEKDIENWRAGLINSKNSTAKLNTKIRITCFNYKDRSYIYFLNNANLGEKYASFIF
nr:non-ribosomal peptide synthetase [Terribacillus saccharophilus]